jgi:large subunit ribosomal protein L13
MEITKPTRTKDIKRAWHLIDVKGKTLGRISTEIAVLLMGKKKPYFALNMDCGDYVVVVNAAKVVVSGKKEDQKTYGHYSGYPSGLKTKTYKQVMIENPVRILRESVAGMLPKNKLRDSMLTRFYISADEKNKYESKFTK